MSFQETGGRFRLLLTVLALSMALNLTSMAGVGVVAWGYGSHGETNVPSALTNPIAIDADNYFSMALQSGGAVFDWGYNNLAGDRTNVPPDSHQRGGHCGRQHLRNGVEAGRLGEDMGREHQFAHRPG